ncbi:MAG: amidohydrolase family protein [Deltaproteobacteria bacterium]|nr:amidohydrolase family protein [Deltaproteobacteria bacterium]
MRIAHRRSASALWHLLIVCITCRALGGMTAAAQSSSSASQPSTTSAFVNGQWFNGTEFRTETVYIVNGRLTRMKPHRVDVERDLTQGFVIPPFGEAHNHNVEGAWNIDAVIQTYLKAGVFYVKNPNNIPDFSEQIRDKINHPTSMDVAFANGGLTTSGGWPIALYEHVLRTMRYAPVVGELAPGWFANRAYFIIDSEADLRERWPQIMARKPDFVKVYLASTENFEKHRNAADRHVRRGVNPLFVPMIVARAHAAGLRVSAHVETASDFHVALVSGVDEIAHLPGFAITSPAQAQQAHISDDDAALAAKNNVTVVTTTRLSHTWHGGEHGHAGGHGQDKALLVSAIEGQQKQNLRVLHQHGVKLAIGSDHDETSVPEALNLHRLGVFDNRTLLKMWTEATPLAIFPGRAIGSLAEGQEASFLVLRCNPLNDFACVEQITQRVKQGSVLTLPTN